MCGIAGIIHLDGRPVDAGLLGAINDRQVHRGPDGGGVWTDGSVGLAHRRLAIIDPAGGHQPMQADGIVISYNGEVYNFTEIRRELEGHYTFRTDSDTEVLLRAYQRWGIDCVNRLRGMFAFAIWDGSHRKLFLVRDRMGIKPLYWARKGDLLVFGSELGVVVAHPDLPREVSRDALASYLYFQYAATPGTIYRNIFKLPPATIMEVDLGLGTLREWRYWAVEPRIRFRPPAQVARELDELLREVIALYVRSDVPFGAFLSGGVDSSTIVAYMGEQLHRPTETFTIGFAEQRYSELPYAAQAATALKSNHHADIVDWRMAKDILPRLASHFAEPFGDSSAVPTYFVCASAARHVKMVLSGDGGDEVFCGYEIYRLVNALAQSRQSLKQRAIMALAPFVPWPRLRQAASAPQSPEAMFAFGRQIFPREDIGRYLGDDFRLCETRLPSLPGTDDAMRAQLSDLGTYMLDDILTKVDRMSMANSIEVRVPLLDHKLVEFGFSLPLESRAAQSEGGIVMKAALKQVGERFFPREFLDRPKMGFGIPVTEWLLGPLAGMLHERLLDPSSGLYDIVDYSAVQSDLAEFCRHSGNSLPSPRIWLLLMLKLWHDEAYRAQPATAPERAPTSSG